MVSWQNQSGEAEHQRQLELLRDYMPRPKLDSAGLLQLLPEKGP